MRKRFHANKGFGDDAANEDHLVITMANGLTISWPSYEVVEYTPEPFSNCEEYGGVLDNRPFSEDLSRYARTATAKSIKTSLVDPEPSMTPEEMLAVHRDVCGLYPNKPKKKNKWKCWHGALLRGKEPNKSDNQLIVGDVPAEKIYPPLQTEPDKSQGVRRNYHDYLMGKMDAEESMRKHLAGGAIASKGPEDEKPLIVGDMPMHVIDPCEVWSGGI